MMSVDGKISTGDTDVLDVDKDYSKIIGVKEGLSQYYDLEQETDLVSINSGRVFEKIGINEKIDIPVKTPISFVVIDNKPHLRQSGVEYLAQKSETLYIATTNKQHPAIELSRKYDNIKIINFQDDISLDDLLGKLKVDYGIKRATVQTGGMLNSFWIRKGLVDRLLLVVAPAIVGGKNTATLVDGESLHTQNDLSNIKALELVRAEALKDSYLLLEYKVKDVSTV
jgi:2,5-diamino-6-(ribosylamino)-4(3H)-pyrimidinone 5'-phosphate reductase